MQAPMPLAHMQINVDPVNLGFYQDLMATLGWRITYAGKEGVEAETDDGADLWFQAGAKDVTNDYDGPGVNHMAFGAASTTDVDAVANYLTGRGVELLFDTPRHRPEFARSEDQTYYQVMFETPDRLLLEVVYIGPKAVEAPLRR